MSPVPGIFAAHLPPLADALFSLLAITSLLLAFVMLGSRWLSEYLLAFAVQSWLIALLSAAIGFYGDYPELYGIAILTALFRGLVLPYLSPASSAGSRSIGSCTSAWLQAPVSSSAHSSSCSLSLSRRTLANLWGSQARWPCSPSP